MASLHLVIFAFNYGSELGTGMFVYNGCSGFGWICLLLKWSRLRYQREKMVLQKKELIRLDLLLMSSRFLRMNLWQQDVLFPSSVDPGSVWFFWVLLNKFYLFWNWCIYWIELIFCFGVDCRCNHWTYREYLHQEWLLLRYIQIYFGS